MGREGVARGEREKNAQAGKETGEKTTLESREREADNAGTIRDRGKESIS